MKELTPRECEFYLLAVTTPLRLKEIAYRMRVELNTVRTYSNKVYKKREVDGRLELILKHWMGCAGHTGPSPTPMPS